MAQLSVADRVAKVMTHFHLISLSLSLSRSQQQHSFDPLKISPSKSHKLIECFTRNQLLEILQDVLAHHPDVLFVVHVVADPDQPQGGRCHPDKAIDKSKRYGFVTFCHVDGALLALYELIKRFNNRLTIMQLATAGNSTSNTNLADLAIRKIYTPNVPPNHHMDKLLVHFSMYGKIEEVVHFSRG
eukprot:XP_014623186.1 UBP1-associated protein 2C-like [Glycine max]